MKEISTVQKPIWLTQSIYPESSLYNVGGYSLIEGSLETELLIRSIQEVLGNSDVIEVGYYAFNEIPLRDNSEFVKYDISVVDFSKDIQPDKSCLQWIHADINKNFQVEKNLLKVTLLKSSDSRYYWYTKVHHLIFDGYSMSLFFNNVAALYSGYVDVLENKVVKQTYLYSDFVQDDKAYKLSDEYINDREFWLNRLNNGRIAKAFLTAMKNTKANSIASKRKEIVIPRSFFNKIDDFCHENQLTVFSYFVSTLFVLNKSYNNEHPVIGLPVFNRRNKKFKNTLGTFVNVLPFSFELQEELTLIDVFNLVYKDLRDCYKHQRFPIYDTLSEINRAGNIYNVSFSYQKNNYEAKLGSLSASINYIHADDQDDDMIFQLLEYSKTEDLSLCIDYKTELFDDHVIQNLLIHFDHLLNLALDHSSVPIRELDYLNASEREQLLVGFNDTEIPYAQDQTLVSLFEQQVVLNPAAVAVVFEDRSLSYAELNRLSSQLGNCLRNKYGVVPDDLIGICLERSEWLIITILGVLKSGAAYVPVDPDYPQERIDYMLSDSNCKVLIDEAWLSLFRSESALYAEDSPVRLNKPTDLAYVIYTSGSTGRPKGVMVAHGGVVNRIEWMWQHYCFSQSDIILQKTTYTFDVSVWELFMPLSYGAKMVLCGKDDVKSPERILSLIVRERVSCLHFVPSMLNSFISSLPSGAAFREGLRTLRLVVTSGEALSLKTVRDWYDRVDVPLHNLYGPTEASVDVTYYATSKEDQLIPIGSPIWNTQMYVINKSGGLQPVGVIGELCIGGTGLARGYLNQPALSSEKFVPNPYRKGERMYKTGDLGRWLSDGNIEYIGRMDDQVKIRGYRIELGEIQNALEGHELVESAVVLSRSLGSSEKELVAYLVGSEELNIASLRSYLGEILPAYMIPGHYVQLEALPLTANGKVDRKSLPDPEGLGMNIGTAYVAARNKTEARLIEVWQEILGKEQIGAKDNFFDLGGHSLKATRLASQIHKVFNVKLGLKELFTHTVLEEQALLLEASSRSLFQGIPLTPLQESYRLSSSQRRLWVLSQFDQANVAYNMPGVYVFEGILDRSGLEDAFSKLIGRHEILRTVFKENEEGDIRQFILGSDETGFHLSYEDLKDSTDQEALVKGLVQQEINKAFDLSGGPLLRAGLYELSEDKWVFVYVMHHIISDGWSMGVLIKELLAFYNAHVREEEASLSPLGIQYKDYADWQQTELSGDSLQSHQDYWQGLFSGELPVLELAGDLGGRPAVKTYNGGIVQGRLSPALTAGLKQLVHEKESTLFMGLLALVNTLLYRYTGQQDIIIGSPVAGREHADLEGQIGFYINTLALRSRFKGEDSYDELLEYTKSLTLGAYEHQVYPFDALVDSLDLQRDMSRTALFDVMLVLQNMDNGDPGPGMEGLSISGYSEGEIQSSKFDLSFNFSELGGELGLNLEYNSDIYSREMAERLSLHLEQLLSAVISAPTVPINQLDYLNASEREQLLVGFNDTEISYAQDQTLVSLFEQQVVLNPAAVAVVFEDRSLSYAELNRLSSQLGNCLRNKYGVVPDDLIGIRLERSEWLIITILGVLKSGAAYVPVDPDYPQERIDYMLSDSNCKVLIDEAWLSLFRSESALYAEDSPVRLNKPTDLAYVIYTSGSTGRPKGVMVAHGGVVNRIEWMWQHYCFSQSDIILQKTTYTFDVSVWELFMPLSYGAKMVLCGKDDVKSPERILSLIVRERVSCLHFVPSMLNSFISSLSSGAAFREGLRTLRLVVTSGEALSLKTVRDWYDRVDVPLHNLYGPTEASVDVTYYATSKEDQLIPIGSPIWNTQMYVINKSGGLQPVGVIGELCIGGTGLARGYLNQPGLSSEKFVPNPYRKGERMYKTGDLGRWLSDGNIEYIGRMDDQVKIRGYRIELGEIQNALEGHELVESAVVLSRSLGSSEKELVAYLVGFEELNIASLRSYLGEILPAYMIPGHYVQLEALPLTANGKVDRKSLPDPEGLGMNIGTAYVAARTETEACLIGVWQEILGKEQIGAKDNFFDLGGHSLKATRLASQIHKVFNVKLGLKELFTHTVLEEQALLLEASSRSLFQGIPLTPLQESYRLSSSQRRLWVLSQFDQANVAYNMPGVYVFEGILDRSGLEDAFSKLIGRHEILRTVFKENEEGDIRQFILGSDETGFHLSYEDLKDSIDQEALVKGLVQQEISTAFDLSGGPLLRAGLYELSEDKWVFVYVMHHIISDGWSMGVLIKELLAFYNAHVSGEEASPSPLGLQYKDYADWQQTELSGDSLQSHQDYWQGLFSGELPVLELAGDKGGRPAVKTYNGGIVQGRLSPALTVGLKQLVHEKESTLFMGLLALVNTLLYRYTGQQDIIIGSPVAGREHADLEGQIGFYINTLALRSRFKGEDSYDELLEYTKSLTLGAYEHQVYPFDALVDSLELQRDMSRTALFDVMLVLQNMDNGDPGPGMEGLSISGYSGGEIQSSKLDLSFNFSELGEELGLNLEYNSDIYSREMAERMSLHLEQLLSAVISAPTVPINQLDYLNASEREQLLVGFNDTEIPYTQDQTLVSLFEQQVVLNPDAVAVVFEDRSLSYAELSRLSSQLGNCLRNKYGVVPDDLIGICLERSEWLIITILGVLKSGAAYVPVDPDYPQERIDYMLSDSNCKVLIDEAWLSLFRSESALYAEESPVSLNQPTDLAYVIYTSGSTGRPKGVMVEHRSVIRLVKSANYIKLTEKSILLSTGAVSFDATTFEYWGMLLNGGQLILCPQSLLLDASGLSAAMSERGVNLMWFTSGWLNQLIDTEITLFKGLKTVIAGGDKLSPVHIQRLTLAYPQLEIINGYGPTENTTFSLTHSIGEVGVNIPIGRPISNSSVYILDGHEQLKGIGIIGEICVGGTGLARGYLNQPVLSSEKFVPNPYRKGERMYKTGDLGRWLSDGNIEYIGRVDDQVKIRGYRIELGEIQTVLEGHEGVESAVVLSRSLGSSEKELVAYLVGSEELNIAVLRTYLGGILPAYMIPGHYVQLEALPLTANGKVDKMSLPDPEGHGMDIGTAYVAPRNETEAQLVEIWQEILGKEQIGAKDNFFELGGHSLKATRLSSQIHKVFGVKIGLRELFTHTILEGQALLLEASSRSLFHGIPLASLQESYGLSSSQRRLWVLSQFDEANVAYNIPGVYVFEGVLDRSGFELAFSKLISRHEILRTVFKEDEQGDIRQFILEVDETGFHLSYEDLKDSADPDSLVKGLVQQEMNKAFDLSRGPLLRAGLYELSEDKWVFVYVMHHIISDGWSMGVLIKELLAFYNAHVRGEEASLSPLGIQYKDYADWQQAELSGDSLQSHQDYWQGLFSGELPVLELAGDKGGRPAVKTYNGGIVQGRLSPALTAGLKQLVHEKESTLFMGLLALVNTLLYRYTGQQDIIIGSPVAAREHADLEGQIGFYVNTLALRSRFKGEDSYDELLGYAKSLTLGAYEHQVYPFDALVDSLELERDMSRSALFDVMLVLQNMDNDGGGPGMEGLNISGYSEGEVQSSKFDLNFGFTEVGGALQLGLEYNSDIYSREMAERLSLHLEQLLSAVISAPSIPIRELDYLSTSELEELLVGFNDTSVSYPVDQTLISLFEQQVVLNPNALAVVFEDRSLSYGELNNLSNQFGNYLRISHDVQSGDLIGIKMERTEIFIVTLLGALKTGAAYLPIDPHYPKERIEFLEKDSNCLVVIDELFYEVFLSKKNEYSILPIAINLHPESLVYLIYTSGSTGNPKGIMMKHTGMLNLINFHIREFKADEVRSVLQFASVSFDVSFQEIFSTLLRGATLYPIGEEKKKDVIELVDFIVEMGIDTLFLPTAYFKLLMDDPYFLEWIDTTVKHIIVAGEQLVLGDAFIEYLKTSDLELHNHYGPAETHVVTTYRLSKKTPSEITRIPAIGYPISNHDLYVLDQNQALMPLGAIGEICISGAGVSRGYLNQEELTEEKFVPNPYKIGEKLYRTGDLGRWGREGELIYLGRRDQQVKIRGYRIELGEIEHVLYGYPSIENAVVIAGEDINGEKSLIAYMVSEEVLIMPEIRKYLAERLPFYMLPGHYMQLSALPLTSNGKLDKRNLPDPISMEFGNGIEYIGPRNRIEEELLSVWQHILGKEKISVKDDFFDLGGHSLKATRLVSQIHRLFNVKLRLKDLFNHPLLEEQAELIQSGMKDLYKEIPSLGYKDRYALSSAQRRLWILSQFEEANVAYNLLEVYVFDGPLNLPALEWAFTKLIDRHEILRTIFKEGEEGEPFQFIYGVEDLEFRIICHDLQDEVEQEKRLKDLIQEEMFKPFDLSKGPLFRSNLYQLSEDKWIFTYVMHHIISDAWSMNILIRELLALYAAYGTEASHSLLPLRVQYKDYAEWQQNELSGNSLKVHKDYWMKQFSGDLPVLELTGEKVRPVVKTYNGSSVHRTISEELTSRLKTVIYDHGATLFMGLHALINTLLYRYTGQEDIIIGSPIAGRQHADLEGQIGFYVNTLALRSRFSGNISYKEMLSYVKDVNLDAYEHQLYPFDELVDALNLHRDMGRNPLFDVMVILQNTDLENEKEGSLKNISVSSYHDAEIQISKFDLTLNFVEAGATLKVNIEYNTDIYTRKMVERLSLHLEQLLDALTSAPSVPINKLNYLNELELNQLLVKFNATKFSYANDKTVISLFEDRVFKTPHDLAVIFNGRTLTYQELNDRSNQLANYLVNKGVVPETLVPICIERGIPMLIGLLGILKSGGAYVPLDPGYPQERISYMLENSKAKLVVSNNANKAKLQAVHIEVVDLDAEWEFIDHETKDPVTTCVLPKNLAYMIYTSGSTGKPKGVMIEHQSLMNFISGMGRVIPLDPSDHLLSITSISFDISILELFWTLCNGYLITIKSDHTALNAFDRFLEGGPVHMDFSLFYFSSQDRDSTNKYDFLMRSVEYADKNDFSAVWLPERHFHEFGGLFPNPAVLAAGLATVTTNIEIRSGSVVLPLHDVIRVAEEWSVVDNLSKGRVSLSIASGWHPDDFVLKPENFAQRQEIMFSKIEELKNLWKGSSIKRMNGVNNEVDVRIFPRPIQQDLQIFITSGGNSETFRNAGKIGAKVLTHLLGQEVEELKNNILIYKEALLENNHSLEKAGVVLMLHTYLGSDLEYVKATVREPFKEYLKSSLGLIKNLAKDLNLSVVDETDLNNLLDIAFDRYWQTSALLGTKDSCSRLVEKLHSIGVTEIACLIDFGIDDEKVIGGLEHLNDFRKIYDKSDVRELEKKPEITSIQITPSYLNALIEDHDSQLFLKSLKHVIVGGERISSELLERLSLRTDATVYNMYGPTETTVWSTSKVLERGSGITIGRPIQNTRIYILDEQKKLCPVGVKGDLFIGGDGLARGYFNEPGLTAERFVQDPFSDAPSDRIYMTGDIAKWLPTGELLFIGRKDDQVKVNGHRIELGEIESVLLQNNLVKQAAVIVGENKGGDKSLIAYIVGESGLFISDIKEYLGTKLPHFMLPNHFVELDSLPLTSNGKINRKALPSFTGISTEIKVEYEPPTNEIEKKLVEIWSELLGIKEDAIGIKDNFFDLGGNSLTIIKMLSIINRIFDKKISLLIAYSSPNIVALSEYINSNVRNEEQAEEDLDVLVNAMNETFNLLENNGNEE